MKSTPILRLRPRLKVMEGDVGKFTAKRDAKRIPTTTQPTARDVLCDLRVLWQSPRIAVPKGLEPLRRANKRSYRMTAFNRLANDFQSRASSSGERTNAVTE